jgi:hypothetical protein
MRTKIRLKSQDGLPDLDAVMNITVDEQGEPIVYVEVNGKAHRQTLPAPTLGSASTAAIGSRAATRTIMTPSPSFACPCNDHGFIAACPHTRLVPI